MIPFFRSPKPSGMLVPNKSGSAVKRQPANFAGSKGILSTTKVPRTTPSNVVDFVTGRRVSTPAQRKARAAAVKARRSQLTLKPGESLKARTRAMREAQRKKFKSMPKVAGSGNNVRKAIRVRTRNPVIVRRRSK